MKTSAEWINAYLNPPATPEEQANAFTAVGFPCESSIPLPNGDIQQEVETTSNRGDCLAHLALAREVAAATSRTFVPPKVARPSEPLPASTAIRVANHDQTRCPRYTARVIRGVKVCPSPEWLRDRLTAIGQIPRNNVVDCTNYVLFEFGQPTHAFDLALLKGGVIEIRAAQSGESFLPIGEGAKAVKLAGGELIIADAERPIALAGVKGGALTAVTEGTTDLLIESASFDPVAVRATSRRHQIASDSSYRFERGVAPADVDLAAERLVQLILETAGGTALSGCVEAGVAPAPLRVVSLRLGRLRSIVGFGIPSDEVVRVLTVLGFHPVPHDHTIECTIPASRLDVTREIDLIEEVVRIAGVDRVPVSETVAIRPLGLEPTVSAARAARASLIGSGLVETVTHTLISERAAAPFIAAGRSCMRTDDERSLGEPILRPSLLPSLLSTLRLNHDRGSTDCAFFEHAATFWLENSAHGERRTMALVVADSSSPEAAYRRARGAVESALQTLRGATARLTVAPSADSPCVNARAAMDPSGTFMVNGEAVGTIGLLRADVLATFGLDGHVAACECDWALASAGYPPAATARLLPNHPALDRDLSLVVGDSTTWEEIATLVSSAALASLESVEFVGLWRGKGIPKGKKSVTLRLLFRAEGRTLRREEVEPEIARLTDVLTAKLGAELRK